MIGAFTTGILGGVMAGAYFQGGVGGFLAGAKRIFARVLRPARRPTRKAPHIFSVKKPGCQQKPQMSPGFPQQNVPMWAWRHMGRIFFGFARFCVGRNQVVVFASHFFGGRGEWCFRVAAFLNGKYRSPSQWIPVFWVLRARACPRTMAIWVPTFGAFCLDVRTLTFC